ncbi:hypothetical protein [Streptomyces sp. NPDC017991]|uniref:hypothetical protein n=1 Tax=Streptomyces sp. NPDC017991 TaxID=3365026 RepID=UPI00378B3DDF
MNSGDVLADAPPAVPPAAGAHGPVLAALPFQQPVAEPVDATGIMLNAPVGGRV